MKENASPHNADNLHISHIACPDCDVILSIPPLLPNEVAYCIRCDATLFKYHKNSIDKALAFAITGLLLFIIANLFPLLSLKALGVVQEGSLLSTATALFQEDHILLSGVVLLTTFIFPATTLLGTIYVLMQVKMRRINRYTAPLFRFLRSTDAWGMLEIFMLAILVALVKLGDVADIIYGVSLYAFCLLILSLSLLSYALNPQDVWDQLRSKTGRKQ